MRRSISTILTVSLVIGLGGPAVLAVDIGDAINRAADDLVSDQLGSGGWLGEFGFTGESVAGLANAYIMTGNASYKGAADQGGDFILYDEGGYDAGLGSYGDYGLFAGGAYGLTRLSEISANPASNDWRTAVGDFYGEVRTGPGTQGFVDAYLNDANAEDTTAVYDLARHAVAASYVGATDELILRSGLIDALADVDDDDNSPVMALGAAVWALARTGDLDGTVISSDPGSDFYNMPLSDLPGMLISHQDAGGGFYTKFNHTLGSSFTEATTMGSLGLLAAYEDDLSLWYVHNINIARNVLAGGVAGDGRVFWKIDDYSYPSYYYLAGETLEVLRDLLPGDANIDWRVDGLDLNILGANWQDSPTLWGQANFNDDTVTNGVDMNIIGAHWQENLANLAASTRGTWLGSRARHNGSAASRWSSPAKR